MAYGWDDLKTKQASSAATEDCCELPDRAFLNGRQRMAELHEQMEPYWKKGKPVPSELYEKQDRARKRMEAARNRFNQGGSTFCAEGYEKEEPYYY